MSVAVARIDEPNRWRTVRDARLLALRSSPEAAGEPLRRAEQFSERQWRAEIARRTWFIAGEPEILGVAAGAWPTSSPSSSSSPSSTVEAGLEARLEAMWVSAHARRRGVGEALVDAVLGWAGERGAASVAVKVAATNLGAIALYRAHGFQPTGERGPLARDTRQEYVVLRAQCRSAAG